MKLAILLLLSNFCVRTIAFRHIDRFLRARWNDGTRGGLNARRHRACQSFIVARGQSIALEEPVSEPIDCSIHNASPPWYSGSHVRGRKVFGGFLASCPCVGPHRSRGDRRELREYCIYSIGEDRTGTGRLLNGAERVRFRHSSSYPPSFRVSKESIVVRLAEGSLMGVRLVSGIAAVLNLDGSAVPQSEIERMANVLKPYGPDRQKILVRGNAAFVFCLHHLTPEDLFERQPLLFANRFVMLFDGRIDNRSELSDSLGIPSSELHSMPDSMIAFACLIVGASARSSGSSALSQSSSWTSRTERLSVRETTWGCGSCIIIAPPSDLRWPQLLRPFSP